MTTVTNTYLGYAVEILNPFFLTFIIGYGLKTIVSGTLEWLNSTEKYDLKEKMTGLHAMHPLMRKHLSTAKINKALRYNSEHERFSEFSSSVNSGFSTVLMLVGAAPFLLRTIETAFPSIHTQWHYVIFSVTVGLLKSLVDIPLEYHSTFSIEGRWGFNRTDEKTFVSDCVKSFVFNSAFASVSILALEATLGWLGRLGNAEIVRLMFGYLVFSFLSELAYLHVIMPLFNTFKPLENGKLLAKLEKLFRKYGYDAKRVLVMDGSRRSTHSNAFICGFGRRNKRIVIYDTMLRRYTDDEIVAILGHELAHGKLGHLVLSRIANVLWTTAVVFAVSRMMYEPSLYRAFGFNWIDADCVTRYQTLGFVLSTIVISSVSWLREPLDSWMSRRMEYAADAMSARITKGTKHLVSALIKLESENLSDVFPNSMYEMWNYDHPSLVNRIRALTAGKRCVRTKMKRGGKVSHGKNGKGKGKGNES